MGVASGSERVYAAMRLDTLGMALSGRFGCQNMLSRLTSIRKGLSPGVRCALRHPEYWIVALPDARLEVYRRPAGDGYRDTVFLRAGESVAPLAAPTEAIPVANLFP